MQLLGENLKKGGMAIHIDRAGRTTEICHDCPSEKDEAAASSASVRDESPGGVVSGGLDKRGRPNTVGKKFGSFFNKQQLHESATASGAPSDGSPGTQRLSKKLEDLKKEDGAVFGSSPSLHPHSDGDVTGGSSPRSLRNHKRSTSRGKVNSLSNTVG